MKLVERIFGLTLIALYFIVGIFTLDKYGINWDEVAHLTRGQAYLYFFLTGKETYDKELFTEDSKHSFYQIPQYDFRYQKVKDGDHPVFSDIMSSLFNYIFYQKLGVINDFDAYHLYGVILTTFFLVFLYFWVEKIYGGFAALVSIAALILYPLFYGESHFNVQKDIPEAVFYGLAVMTFYTGYIKLSLKWILLSALFFGFALGTKFNILFMPLTISLWLIIKERTNIFRKIWGLSSKLKLAFLAYPFIGFGIFFFSWPHLWYDPLRNLLQVFGYYREFGIAPVATMPSTYYIYGFNTYAIQWILYITPLIVLLLFAFGLIYLATKGWKEKNKTSLLILLWFLVPIIRVTVPGTSIYGGVRQIMEYIPAMAILAGIGANYMVTLLHGFIVGYKKQLNNRTIQQLSSRTVLLTLQILTILMFFPITLKIISLHPNESIYFNPIVGGLKGAKEKDIPGWGNSLGSTYRQGTDWLNQYAEKGAKVALIFENISSIPRTLLREDINYSNTYRSGLRREREYVIGVTHYGTHEEFYHRKYLERFLIPVYEVKVDGVAVLKIWENELVHTKLAYRKKEEAIEPFAIRQDVERGRLIIEFSKVIKLTRVEILYKDENCIIPVEGKIRISKHGKFWQTLPETFLYFPGFPWFQPDMEEGKLQYLFAADELGFLRFSLNPPDSCLLKHPIKVKAWEI